MKQEASPDRAGSESHRMGKHNLSGFEKDKEAMQKDKEAIFGKEKSNG
jgi:hypothetical protein